MDFLFGTCAIKLHIFRFTVERKQLAWRHRQDHMHKHLPSLEILHELPQRFCICPLRSPSFQYEHGEHPKSGICKAGDKGSFSRPEFLIYRRLQGEEECVSGTTVTATELDALVNKEIQLQCRSITTSKKCMSLFL